ncbi:MAG: TonB-dependent receptor, partial [candidate division KSB1 bacterium]
RSTEPFFDNVTASRRAESAFHASAEVAFVEADQIATRPALTPTEHLKALPAVDFVSSGLNQSNVVLRGFNNVFSGALLFLADYRPAGVPSLRYNAFHHLPLANEDVERIEMVSGAASALYGPNSANGLMHVITKSPFGSEGTTITFGGGERSLLLGSLRHAGSFKQRVGYKISMQYYRGNDWEYRDAAEPDSFRTASGVVPSPGRDFQAEKLGGEARVDLRLAEDFTAIFSGGFNRQNNIELTGLGAVQAKDWTYSYVQGRFSYKNVFAQAYLNRSDAGNTFILRTGAPIIDRSRLLGAQVQHGFALGARQRFTYGLDFLRTLPNTEGTITGRYEKEDDTNEVGAFLQSETALFSKLDLIMAGRVDEHSHLNEPTISPRAALLFKPSARQNFRLTYNRAFSTPTTNNLFLDLLSATVPSPLPPPFPRTLLAIRAQGVPSRTGFTFQREASGRPLMRSQLAPGAGYVPANVNTVWPALRQILIGGSPAELRALLNATLPQQFAAEVRGDFRALNPTTGKFDLVADVFDVAPMEPTITNTFEIGYKVMLGSKLFFTSSLYHSRFQDFIGPLKVETPNVFADPAQLYAALQPAAGAITNALLAAGLPNEAAQSQARAIVNGLVASAAQLPLGVITPSEIANDTDVILTYRNFGDISLIGADLNLTYYATAHWIFNGNYSYMSRDLFSNVEGISDIALNSPRHKIGGSVRYRDFKRGLETQLRVRYVDRFPVRSGVYLGTSEAFWVADANADYQFAPRTKLTITAQNLFDRQHVEIVGAPALGRLGIVRITQSF